MTMGRRSGAIIPTFGSIRGYVYRSTSQSITDNTSPAIIDCSSTSISGAATQYMASAVPSGGGHGIKVLQSGWYTTYVEIDWASNATGFRDMRLRGEKGGQTIEYLFQARSGADVNAFGLQVAEPTIFVPAGVILYITARQQTGGALNATYGELDLALLALA